MIFNKVLSLIRKEVQLKSSCRSISQTPVMETRSRTLARFKKLQAEFQCDDGVPIFLKTGIMDRVLYSTTVFLSCVGVTLVVLTIFDFAKPTSWKKPQ